MEIQCECGKFRAELARFPKDTPGRLGCYCDDCQSYLHYIKRPDLLDANGRTEIVPIYPSDFKFVSGAENLKCTRLHEGGMYRFSTTCCNTPVANTDPRGPWVGTHRRMFTSGKPDALDSKWPKIRSTIMGKFGHGTLPAGTPEKFDLKGMALVAPFMLKGILLGRKKPSPFFDGDKPVVAPHVLTADERKSALMAAGFQ